MNIIVPNNRPHQIESARDLNSVWWAASCSALVQQNIIDAVNATSSADHPRGRLVPGDDAGQQQAVERHAEARERNREHARQRMLLGERAFFVRRELGHRGQSCTPKLAGTGVAAACAKWRTAVQFGLP